MSAVAKLHLEFNWQNYSTSCCTRFVLCAHCMASLCVSIGNVSLNFGHSSGSAEAPSLLPSNFALEISRALPGCCESPTFSLFFFSRTKTMTPCATRTFFLQPNLLLKAGSTFIILLLWPFIPIVEL